MDAGDATGAFEGLRDMGNRLATSRYAHDCFVERWLKQSLGRANIAGLDVDLADLQQRFVDEGSKINDMVLMIASHEAFRTRFTEVRQ